MLRLAANRRIPLPVALAAASALALGAATANGGRAPAVPIVGVADDAPKYAEDGGAAIYAQLRSLGMR